MSRARARGGPIAACEPWCMVAPPPHCDPLQQQQQGWWPRPPPVVPRRLPLARTLLRSHQEGEVERELTEEEKDGLMISLNAYCERTRMQGKRIFWITVADPATTRCSTYRFMRQLATEGGYELASEQSLRTDKYFFMVPGS